MVLFIYNAILEALICNLLVFLNLNFAGKAKHQQKRTNDERETLFLSFFQMDVLDRRGANYQD